MGGSGRLWEARGGYGRLGATRGGSGRNGRASDGTTKRLDVEEEGKRKLGLGTAAGPPPRVPNANSGGVVGPVLSCDGGHRSIKDNPEARDTCRSGVFLSQPLSQPIVTSPHGMIREKSLRQDANSSQEKQPSTQCNVADNPVSRMVIDVNPIQYFPSLAERKVAINAKVFQAQSQLAAVDVVAAVAIAAHQNVGSTCSSYLAHCVIHLRMTRRGLLRSVTSRSVHRMIE
ncbi:hypothetical protein MLD38_035132 [Melastoma candidum]|uniref:Uncharacterized protein n=1 Tax=Melastoma candidum TaxID=119954 RepID=A0ACB9MED1_9MYRT|nr:hypothetical protein MLD38_035132 [Melastoma candidum]